MTLNHVADPTHPTDGSMAEALAARLRPSHRRVPARLRIQWAAAVMLVLLSLAGLIGIGGLLARATVAPQLALDTLAALGFGRSDPEAKIVALSCRHEWIRARTSFSYHRCEVEIENPTRHVKVDVLYNRPLDRAEARGIVIIGGELAVLWPASVVGGRWLEMVPVGIGLTLLALAGGVGWRGLSRLRRRIALLRHGTPRPADLLARQWMRRSRRGPRARWTFAYDDEAGQRHYGSSWVESDPLILDGVVTRGIVLLSPGGEVELMQSGGWPFRLDPEDEARLETMLAQIKTVPRQQPRFAPRFDTALVGAERAYIDAFLEAWSAVDAASVTAAIERRHAAAVGLSPAVLDHLLRAARRAVENADPAERRALSP